jgi:uncharacterized membrane protein YccF (DUF307 family)
MRTLGNIIWIVLGGFLAAGAWLLIGLIFYVTIIGIPLGRQAMKMAELTLAPFGRTVIYGGGAPSLIANIVWLAFAGVPMAFGYCMIGVMLCCTVVGIPVALQAFKMAKLSLMPFGAQVI